MSLKSPAMKSFIHLFLLVLFIAGTNTVCSQEITINESFSSDTVFRPFTSNDPIYGLTIRGDCTLISDSSLIRVVLIDDHGNHLLVFEAYPLIDTSNIFSSVSKPKMRSN